MPGWGWERATPAQQCYEGKFGFNENRWVIAAVLQPPFGFGFNLLQQQVDLLVPCAISLYCNHPEAKKPWWYIMNELLVPCKPLAGWVQPVPLLNSHFAADLQHCLLGVVIFLSVSISLSSLTFPSPSLALCTFPFPSCFLCLGVAIHLAWQRRWFSCCCLLSACSLGLSCSVSDAIFYTV